MGGEQDTSEGPWVPGAPARTASVLWDRLTSRDVAPSSPPALEPVSERPSFESRDAWSASSVSLTRPRHTRERRCCERGCASTSLTRCFLFLRVAAQTRHCWTLWHFCSLSQERPCRVPQRPRMLLSHTLDGALRGGDALGRRSRGAGGGASRCTEAPGPTWAQIPPAPHARAVGTCAVIERLCLCGLSHGSGL